MAKDVHAGPLIGRRAQAPPSKHTRQGALIVPFTVTTGRTFKDSQGNQREEPEWTKVTCWPELTELAQG